MYLCRSFPNILLTNNIDMQTKEEFLSYLSKIHNDIFRKSIETDSSAYVYDNSINTAKEIVSELASHVLRTNHCFLLAKMQSGKTSVCNSVVNVITQSSLDKDMCVKKFLFITGMNDCGLHNQTHIRIKEQVIGASVDNIYYGKRCKRNMSENQFYVLKNSDLKDFDEPIDNSVIFIDESHYGSNERNHLTKFLVRHGIDWKNTNDLIKRNIYIVSISATPFDEIVSDTLQCKRIIELKTDNAYVGVSEYLKKELVFDADKNDIEDGKIFDYIADAHNRMIENHESGIVFIRTRNFQIFKDAQYIIENFDIFEMYSGSSRIEYQKLNELMDELTHKNNVNNKAYLYANNRNIQGSISPIETKPLLVLIKGAFRAGITIDAKYKDLIYMVYDYSLKADTTAQALLGRMCGYRNQETSVLNTYFYINKKFAEMYSVWENNFTNRNAIPCDKSEWNWCENTYQGNDVKFGSRSCGNFTIELDDEDLFSLYNSCKGKRNKIEVIEYLAKPLLNKYGYGNIEYDYIAEAYVSGKNTYAQSTQKKRFDDYTEDSLVCQFRPEKMKNFQKDTNRDYLSKEDLGKKAISIVLDATIHETPNGVIFGGNRRLLVYYVEVGQKRLFANRKKQYKIHKDTSLVPTMAN